MFVNFSASSNEGTKRFERVYVHRMHQWIMRFTDRFIDIFELYFPNPNGLREYITSLVEFTVSK